MGVRLVTPHPTLRHLNHLNLNLNLLNAERCIEPLLPPSTQPVPHKRLVDLLRYREGRLRRNKAEWFQSQGEAFEHASAGTLSAPTLQCACAARTPSPPPL
eukprot:76713-Chlamydomonas_euryale.AAC.2